MDTGHHFESEHRGVESRHAPEGGHELKVVHSSNRETTAPAVEFGSGWYHDEAITHSHDIASHRSM